MVKQKIKQDIWTKEEKIKFIEKLKKRMKKGMFKRSSLKKYFG